MIPRPLPSPKRARRHAVHARSSQYAPALSQPPIQRRARGTPQLWRALRVESVAGVDADQVRSVAMARLDLVEVLVPLLS